MKKIALRGAAVAAAAGIAIGGLSTGAANADTVMRFPTATTTQKVGDGNITVTVTNHVVRLSPGMVALPSTRNAWVSGVVSAKVDGAKADGGSITAGYVVGCQVDIGSASVGGKVGVSSVNKDGNSWVSGTGTGTGFQNVSASGSTNATLSLKAGGIGTQFLTYDRATWPQPGDEIAPDWADPSTDFKFKGKSGSLAFSDQTIGVDGCAGYAQARFFAKVKAKNGNTEGYVILWTKPFTLG